MATLIGMLRSAETRASKSAGRGNTAAIEDDQTEAAYDSHRPGPGCGASANVRRTSFAQYGPVHNHSVREDRCRRGDRDLFVGVPPIKIPVQNHRAVCSMRPCDVVC